MLLLSGGSWLPRGPLLSRILFVLDMPTNCGPAADDLSVGTRCLEPRRALPKPAAESGLDPGFADTRLPPTAADCIL